MKTKSVKSKIIVIVAHKFLTQPDDELVDYLNKNLANNVIHIRHSFSDAKDRCSYYSFYKKGILVEEIKTKDYKNYAEPIIYLKELYFTLKWVKRDFSNIDVYIGMDGLCTFFGFLLKKIINIEKIIFWAMDFVPYERFHNKIKNFTYHLINKFSYRNSDEMWDLSPRMVEAREKEIGFSREAYKLHRVVPYGMVLDRLVTYDYEDCEKNTLVFMGHLLEKQGVQLVIRAIPEILKNKANFVFKIIGDGEYKNSLIKLSRELNVEKYCNFMGKIPNTEIRKLENEVARSCLSIAPYIKELDKWTYYADPGKVKTYLACGVPVLLTEIPWNAKDIERNKCGKIITEEIQSIVENVCYLMNPKVNSKYRLNARKYSEQFDYYNIFNSLDL